MIHSLRLRWFSLVVFVSLSTFVQAQTPPIVDFSVFGNDTVGCESLTAIFQCNIQSTHPITNYAWDLGGQPGLDSCQTGRIFDQPGFYTITLTVTDAMGNTGTLTKTNYIQVANNPVVGFTASQVVGCGTLDAQLTNTSTVVGSTVDSAFWLIGTTSYTTLNVPSHQINSPGCQTLFLRVFTPEGCRADTTLIDYLCVEENPIASFTSSITNTCDSVTDVSFTNTSTHSTPANLTYQWDFGDGIGTSTAQNPNYTYNGFGTFTVSLTTTDTTTMCSNTVTNNVVINPNNVVAFTFSPTGACPGQTVQFTNQSIGTATGYLWDFGDGNTSTSQNPTHSYATAGCYTVSLTTTFSPTCIVTETFDCFTVSPPPTGSFTVTSGDLTTCTLPHNVTFSANVNGASNFFWDFEGTLVEQNNMTPTHTFTNYGTYPISLVMISGQGCSTTVTTETIEIQELTVDFAADTTSGCIPLSITYTNTSTSTSPITNTNWIFGDGNTFPILANNLSHSYNSTGQFDVSLIVTNSFGCIDTLTRDDFISAGSVPDLGFTASPNPSCVGAPITFTNASDPNASNFNWDFGDGNGTSTDVNPTYTYQDTGAYTITLSGDFNGCPNTVIFNDTIQVLPPIAYFTTDLSCDSLTTVQFINQSAFADTYLWTFGDGNTSTATNPRHTYANLGFYNITLTATNSSNGCSHTYVDQVNLLEPIADFGNTATQACTPAPANIVIVNNSVNAQSYSWNAPNGTYVSGDTAAFTPVLQYDSAGIYDITLIITDSRGCMDTTIQTICVTDVFIDTAATSVDTMQLQLSGASIFCGVDGYVDQNGTQSLDTLSCYWTDCTPLTVAFRDSSFSFPDTTISWLWDFGDGNTSTIQNPTHTYANPSGADVYLVTLTITNVYGSTATDTVAAIRPTQPITNFTLADTIFCVGEDIGITNSSSGVDIDYAWDFGNGATDTVRTPMYAYDSIGIYTVTLTTTDMNGCDSTITRTITVEQPVAGFFADTTYSDCAALTVQFADTSVGAVAWSWDFGTGNPADISVIQDPTFIFSVSDTYDVQLIITSVAGCTDTITQSNLVVVDGPRAEEYTVAPLSGCIDHEAVLAARGLNIAQYTWVTGTVNLVTGVPDTITHVSNDITGNSTDTLLWTYTRDSVFFTELLVEDQFGCPRNYALTTPVTTTDPQAIFAIDTTAGCAPLSLQVTNTSNDANQYAWRVPSANISNSGAATPTITFPSSGIYDTIELIVTDIHGCQDTMIVTDSIYVSDVFAGFAVDSSAGCVPLPVNFTDTSSTFLGTLTRWDWNFGDGVLFSDTSQNISHIYTEVPANNGTRTARLIAYNSWGCTDVIQTTIIPSFPSVFFNLTDTFVCTGQNVSFVNFSNGRNVTYLWDFGDGNTSTVTNPTHNYATEDTFMVCLTATDENGCDSTYCRQIVVGNPQANFGADVTFSACPPLITSFSDSSVNAIAWQWDLGNGSMPPIQNPVTVYPEPGFYDVTLIVTSQSGCMDTLTRSNYIQIDGPIGSFGYSPLEGCEPFTIDFSVVTQDAVTGTIDFGDGQLDPLAVSGNTSSDTLRFSKTYLIPGNYVPKLSITDVNGCTRILSNDADTIRITDPQAEFTLDVTEDCHPFAIVANSDSSEYANTYQWFAPSSSTTFSTLANPVFPYGIADIDTIMLVVTDVYGCTDTMRQEIISSEVFPAGTTSADVGCRPMTVSFTDNSTTVGGMITNWNWNFGDGNSSTDQNPTHTYTSNGTFVVSLTITNSIGCSKTENIDTITVTRPVSNFNMSSNVACTFQDITFGNLSSGVNITYAWNFGDGNTSTALNPTHSYAAVGSYNVCLTVTDENGCDSTTCQSVTVVDPIANFTSTPTYQSCPSGVYQMVNSSSNDVAWMWAVYDGSDSIVATSTDENPSFTLDIPDFYDVQLIVTSPSGCMDTLLRTNYLELDGPKATFSATPIVGCEPLPITFSVNTDNVVDFTLYYGDGDSINQTVATPTGMFSYNHTFDDGTFIPTISIRDGAGCERTLAFDTINVTPFNVDFVADDTLHCENGTIQFTSQILTTLPIDSILWRFEGADVATSTMLNPSIPYSMVGDYDVTLIIGNGFCLDSLTKTDFVKIAPNPVTSFTVVPDSACVPRSATFTNTSTIASGTIDSLIWDFNYNNEGDTNLLTTTFLYDVANTYNPTLTTFSNFGCTTTETVPITIYPLPAASFTKSDTFACTGQAISFTNTSAGTSPTYLWDFGDGNTSTDANPSHAWATEDTFTVLLTVTDSFGCVMTTSQNVVVANPVAFFIATSTFEACPPATFTFNNNSDNDISWQWYVYNSDTLAVDSSTLEVPSFTLTIPDLYDVQLIVTSPSGCTDTMMREDYLWLDGPIADFAVSPTVGCEPLPIDFTINTTSVAEFVVMFGDGDSTVINTPAATETVTHTYNSGVFVPVLIIRDAAGCERQLPMDTVNITPFNVDFLADDTLHCETGTIQFTSQILTTLPVDSILWRFEGADVMTSTATNPSIPYSVVGDYDVTLIVGNGFCLDSLTRTDFVKIAPNPVTSYTVIPDSACVPRSVTFTNTSTIASGTIDSLIWDFGYNSEGDTNLQTTTFLYDVANTYTTTLTTYSDFGCTTTETIPLTIYPLPVAGFTKSDTFVCTGQAVSFTNTSVGTSPTYLWDFGDGNTSTAINPTHAWATEDTFTVLLTVTDSFGCVMTTTQSVIVANPVANFTADTTYGPCIVQTISFFDQSLNAVAWEWHFGDDSTSTLQNPMHTYQEPGLYDVTLIVTSQSGCMDTLNVNDYITIDGPSGSFSYTPLTGCVPQDVQFTASGDSISVFTWYFGDGDSVVNNVINNDNVVHTYQAGGVYYPTLKIEDSKGCFVILDTPDSLRVDEMTIDFSSDVQIICTQGFVNFNSIITSNQAVDSVSWLLPGATTPQSTALNPSNIFYNTLGLYDVTLIVHSGFCSDTLTKTDFIRVAPTPVASYTYGPDPICTDVPFTFADSSSLLTGNIVNWDWSDGLAYNDANQSPAPYATTLAGNYNVTLTVTSDFGCVDDTIQTITVFQTPTADAGPDQHICINDVAYLNGLGGGSYEWTPSASLSCSTCPDPIANPLTPTTYQLLVTTADGCTDTDLMFLDVGPFALPVIGLNNDTLTICEGETTQLFASGGIDVTSYIWDSAYAGLSCYEHCSNPFANPIQTTTYYVQVTGVGGCVNYDSITVVVVTDNGTLAGNDVTICEGDSYQLTTAFGNNPTWSPQAELSCTFCANPIATPSETTTFTVTVTGSNGCVITDSITINVVELASVDAGADEVICTNGAVELNAQGSGTITWSPSATLDNPSIFNPTATPSETTIYTATITDGLCTIVDSMIVFVESQASIMSSDTTICADDSAQLLVTGLAQEVTWTPATGLTNPNSFNPIAFPDSTTTYEVVGTLDGCNADTTYVTVFVEQTPDIELLPNPTGIAGEQVQLANGPDSYTYQWSPNIGISCLDCPNPFVIIDTATTYMVTFQTELGCENTATVTVDVTNACDETLIDLPQAFSPNGDGLNDIFYVRSTSLDNILEFRVYSQWGEEIYNWGDFRPNDPDTGWDGTFNGRPAPQGVYIYQTTSTCPIDGSTILKKGNFMLIR